jgi:hypothetical protein
MMQVPIIGQQQKAPVIAPRVGIAGQHIVIELVMLGCDVRQCPLTPEEAGTICRGIGQGIEHLCPGQLEPFLLDWLGAIRAQKQNGDAFVATLKCDG